MKQWIVCLTAVAMLAAGCATTDTTAFSGSEVNLAGSRSAVLTVHGLSCPLCSNNLDGQLRRIDGVEDAVIELSNGEVTVRLTPDHAVTPDDLAKAVQQAGFTLKSLSRGPDEQ